MAVELKGIVKDIMGELKTLLEEIFSHKKKDKFESAVFFRTLREEGLFSRLSQSQVDGINAKITAFKQAKFPLSWAAYAMATSYHETGKRMQPVKEGLGVSEEYRRKNFRYYPYYGRGDVQLTWKENYERADRELGLQGKLLENLDLALDPDISAKILVEGMKEGWFSKGRTLAKQLPNNEGTIEEFTDARRMINLMDKATSIAGYAMKFQQAFKKARYGE